MTPRKTQDAQEIDNAPDPGGDHDPALCPEVVMVVEVEDGKAFAIFYLSSLYLAVKHSVELKGNIMSQWEYNFRPVSVRF